MMKGSVAVKVGDVVETGQYLGLIGLSGNTAFPHLHFAVSRDGIRLDPYTGLAEGFVCGAARTILWSDDAALEMFYVPGAALQAGFADVAALIRTAREGGYDDVVLETESPNLVFWAEFFGLEQGDRLKLSIHVPDGSELVSHVEAVERDRALQFQFAGRKRPDNGWPSGVYRGEAQLVRIVDDVEYVVDTISETIEIY